MEALRYGSKECVELSQEAVPEINDRVGLNPLYHLEISH